jgi:DegV family protein with EDD domain
MNIAIITDSTSDVPYDLAQKHDIHIVPNIVVIEGKSVEDNPSFSRQKFYEQLPQMQTPPTTAAASAGVFQMLYEKLFEQGVSHIISIHASSLLSGIFNAASLAAQAFEGRVHVVDSQQVSLGLGFQALAAAEAVARGLPLQAVLDCIADVRKRVRVVAMLDTLEYVRRSGRVSWLRASLGSLLNVKLFVEIKDGLVQRLGEVRTRGKGIARLLELLHTLEPLERLAILHTNAEVEARQILAAVQTRLSAAPLVVNVTTVIGAHVGPNGLGFAVVVAQ